MFFVLIGQPGPSWEVQTVDVATADDALGVIAATRPAAVTLGAIDADAVTWQQLTRSISRTEVTADDALTAVTQEQEAEVVGGRGSRPA